MPTPAPQDEDELDGLPPIDGEAGDEAEPSEDWGADKADKEGGAARDEAAREGDPSGLEDDVSDAPADASELDGDETESGWVDEAADNEGLDVGDTGLLDAVARGEPGGPNDGTDRPWSPDDGEAPQVGDEDFGLEELAGGLDPGADDGPLDADEELREEDLPALDADEEETESDDTNFVDEQFSPDEPLGVPWAASPWARVGAPVGITGALGIACAPRGALVGLRGESGASALIRVDLEGTRQGIAAAGLAAGQVRGLAAEGDTVAVLLEGGRLFLSRSGGERFEPVAESAIGADLALASGILWIRTKTGSLLSTRVDSSPTTGPLEHCPVPGAVVALATNASGGILALALDAAGRPSALVRGSSDGSVECEGIDVTHLPQARPPSPVLLTTRAGVVAFSVRGGVARRASDGIWHRLGLDGRITALSFVDDGGTLLAATYSQADDTTGLVRMDASGRPAMVAKVGAAPEDPDSDGRAVAIACDDARGVVWIAGGFGVVTLLVTGNG
jgi:hypothetical protein